MRTTHLLQRALVLFLLAAISMISSAQTRATSRISQSANDQQVTALRDNVHPFVRRAVDQGPVAQSKVLNRVVMHFKRSDAQEKALELLLQQQQDPASPNYHKWLTPEQFADRFGMTNTDLAKVSSWLQAHGMKVVDVARGRDWIAFSGTTGQIGAAFRTQFRQYSLNGETHFANATSPSIPSAFADVVRGIQSLNDFRPQPRIRRVKANFTSSISGLHFLAPEDVATIYNVKGLYNAGVTGTGQKIAVAGQSDISLTDVRAFRTASGLAANDPTIVLVPGSADPGQPAGDIVEASLDVEWAGALAKNAQITYVNSTNVFNSMQYAIDQNIAPIISISYGDCEPDFADTDIAALVAMAQKANAQGQTIIGPSGDDAAADCDFSTNANVQIISAANGLQVDVPASLPYVTGVGGTTLNDTDANWNASNTGGGGSAIAYIPEVAWNDTAAEISSGGSLTGTGGGRSRLFAKPTWQTGSGVPNDGARDVPDISFDGSSSHDGYLICSQGNCVNGFRNTDTTLFPVGGTSVGVPVFASILALIEQQTGSAQGNINPKLYTLAASHPAAFHDITNGDNKVPCVSGTLDCPAGTTSIGFLAGTGYDLVTGLGSVDTSALAAVWGNFVPPVADFAVSSTNTNPLSITHGTTGTVNVTVAAKNGFTGAVTISCSVSTGLGTTTCTPPGPITTSGSANVTITAQTTLASTGHDRPLPHRGWLYESGFALCFGLVFTLRNRRRMLVAIAVMIVTMCVLASTACGGSGGGTTTGGGKGTGGTGTPLTGTVTIHATSGNLSHDTIVVVNVI